MKKMKWFVGACLAVFILGVTASYAQTASSDEAKAKAQQWFDSTDTNKDGKISKEEFLAKCKGKNCSQRFDALDTNKDGFLDREEAKKEAEQAKEKASGLRQKFQNRRQSGQQPTD